jgi:hypothetical protein
MTYKPRQSIWSNPLWWCLLALSLIVGWEIGEVAIRPWLR